MDANLIKTFGQIAGIGGLALGVFLILFREIIRKNIFPHLNKSQAYFLLRLIIILVWSVAVLGIVSWVYIQHLRKEVPPNRREVQHLSLPTFERQEIGAVKDIEDLEAFVNENLGKLVYINTAVSMMCSEIGKTDTGGDELTLSSLANCNRPDFYLSCATSHLLIKGKDHSLGFYKGMHVFNGFFVIGENVELHQGTYYQLESVPRAQVLIELQKEDRSQATNSPTER